MVSAPSIREVLGRLRHAEALKGIGQGTGDPRQVSYEAGAPDDVGVDGIGGHFALVLGGNDLLFEERSEQLVGILNRTERQNICGVDLVEDLNFTVQVRVAGQ